MRRLVRDVVRDVAAAIEEAAALTPPARLLVIAGSDSGGGAGIQADIKTATALGAYAMTAVTAVTVQNTQGVHAIHPIPADIVRAQIVRCSRTISARTPSRSACWVRPKSFRRWRKRWKAYARDIPLVVDPVMVRPKAAHRCWRRSRQRVDDQPVPACHLVTPNAAGSHKPHWPARSRRLPIAYRPDNAAATGRASGASSKAVISKAKPSPMCWSARTAPNASQLPRINTTTHMAPAAHCLPPSPAGLAKGMPLHRAIASRTILCAEGDPHRARIWQGPRAAQPHASLRKTRRTARRAHSGLALGQAALGDQRSIQPVADDRLGFLNDARDKLFAARNVVDQPLRLAGRPDARIHVALVEHDRCRAHPPRDLSHLQRSHCRVSRWRPPRR